MHGQSTAQEQQGNILSSFTTLLEAVRHFCSVVVDAGSRGTTAHAHQCCIFQSYKRRLYRRE